MMDVFTLTGKEMEDEGNFYASMFIVLAAGCLISYFTLGYSTNIIAQVRRHPFTECRNNANTHVDSFA